LAEVIGAEKFLHLQLKYPVIDVRSPGEYEQGHIPGAFNIPLFDNNERAIVGTLYKQQGRRPSILKGLELAGKKLPWYVQESLNISKQDTALVHCWRGGMRSSSFSWFLESIDMKTYLLEGGYKTYRRYIRNKFNDAQNIVVLSGMTGVGKTDLLKLLKEKGEQVIDLEEYANHRGSAFGSIGMGDQPSTEQFENNSASEWLTFDMTKRIWIEDESLKIGRCVINEILYSKMRQAPVISIEVPIEQRVERIFDEYCFIKKEELISVVRKISRRLGDERTKQAIESFETENYKNAIRVLLDYYDRTYKHGQSKRKPETIKEISFQDETQETISRKLIEIANSL
jgi:tRNA 2-selenouridine synthase